MNRACELCKGACCKQITFSLKADGLLDDYLTTRGTKSEVGYSFNCECPKLKSGKCSIYETRPEVCKRYIVGSPACRNAIKLNAKHPKRVLDEIDKQHS